MRQWLQNKRSELTILPCGMKDETRKGKVEVASHDRDLRASRFPRAKEKRQGERSEYIVLPLIRVLPLTCESRHGSHKILNHCVKPGTLTESWHLYFGIGH